MTRIFKDLVSSVSDLRQPGVNFINVLCVRFLYEILLPKISNPKHSFVIFGAKITYKNCVLKMLMKLISEVNFINILHAQIPNAQKRLSVLLYLFEFLGSVCIKATTRIQSYKIDYVIKKSKFVLNS